jgi:hypothetical protein
MGVPPMSLTGILPVCVAFSFLLSWHSHGSRNCKDTGGTPVRLMGKMPMLLFESDSKYYYCTTCVKLK